jgi:hypothetical protein
LTFAIWSSSEVGWSVGLRTAMRSFLSMCRSVVLPALSRPRNKSLAFLFMRPSDDRTSKNQLTIHMMAVELGLPGSRGVIQHSRLMMGGLRARAAVKMQRVRG